eukprot:NODE_583_length_6431_cov_0.491788.p7 type:complete len:128 gc:universal NODE_583_length_6431_cov_0.491788:5556-5173(-)
MVFTVGISGFLDLLKVELLFDVVLFFEPSAKPDEFLVDSDKDGFLSLLTGFGAAFGGEYLVTVIENEPTLFVCCCGTPPTTELLAYTTVPLSVGYFESVPVITISESLELTIFHVFVTFFGNAKVVD